MSLFRSSLLLLLSLPALSVVAQPRAEYPQPEVRLGDVHWHVPVQARFEVRNMGSHPLTITDVRTDCGCTAAAWSRSAVAPGQSATITATFDAATLGTFVKQVRVLTDADAEPRYLRLSGRVVADRVKQAGEFPYSIGNLRLSTDNIEFDEVHEGEIQHREIYVYNGSSANYMPELMHLPKYLTAYAEPEVVRPGKIGKIHLSLASHELHAMGLTQTSIYLARFSGDKVGRDNEIGLSATLVPDVTLTPQERAVAPQAKIDTLIDLGSFGRKSKLKGQLTLTNTGHSNLVVSALQVYNPGISVSLSKSVLRPGERAQLKVSVTALTDQFRGSRRILLITNDPTRPKIIVRVERKK